jgi:hypothetical protein
LALGREEVRLVVVDRVDRSGGDERDDVDRLPRRLRELLQLGLGEGDEAILREFVALDDLPGPQRAELVVVALGHDRGARRRWCRFASPVVAPRRRRRCRVGGRGPRRLAARRWPRLVFVDLLEHERRLGGVGDVLAANARATAREQLETQRCAALGRGVDLHRDRDEPEADRERRDRTDGHARP